MVRPERTRLSRWSTGNSDDETGTGVTSNQAGAYFVVDARQRIVEWSEAAATLLGVPAGDAEGLPCYAVIQGHDAHDHPICQPGCSAFAAVADGRLAAGCSFSVNQVAEPRWLRCELNALPARPGGALVRLAETVNGACEPARADARPDGVARPPDIVQDLSAFAALATSLSPDNLLESLEQSLDLLREATGAESAELFLAEPAGRDMLLTAYRGPFRRAFCERVRFAPGEGFPGLVMQHRQPLFATELVEDARYLRDKVREKGYRSYVCVPLFAAQTVLGAICVGSRRADVHPEQALRLLSWASVPIATALQAGLLRAGHRTMAPGIPSGGEDGDLDSVLREILRRVRQLAHADDGTLVLRSRVTGGVVRRVSDGAAAEPVCPGFDCAAVAHDCPALNGGHGVALYGSRPAAPLPCQRRRRHGSATYCLPLQVDGANVGLIQLNYLGTEPFPPTRHLGLLLEVADQAAPVAAMVSGLVDHGHRVEPSIWRQHPALDQSSRGSQRSSAGGARRVSAEQGLALHVRCFGSFELYREGVLLSPQVFKRRKAQSLLKILLVHAGRPVAKDTLIEYLWPETDPEAGANRLHGVVHALREVIEPAGSDGRSTFVRCDGDNYIFDPQAPCWVDLAEFRDAVAAGRHADDLGDAGTAMAAFDAAVRLYRGDLLEDDSFAEWCWLEREYLRETYLATLQQLAVLHAAAGDLERSINGYRQLLRHDPLREAALRQLMERLGELGRRDEALHHFELFCQLLRRELDMAPLPETHALAQRIRSAAPA